MLLYKYVLADLDSKDDIERLRRLHRYKVLTAFETEGQTIVSTAAVNSFLSHIAVFASSNKAIEVVDYNANKTGRLISNAHDRPVHTIAFPSATRYASHPPAVHDTFVTASTDGDVKVWDLRTRAAAATLCGHVNRAHRVGVAFSPCMRYIACGSEDKQAYLYDIRGGARISTLQGHKDVVSGIAFNPLHPQIVTASLDGHLRTFIDKM